MPLNWFEPAANDSLALRELYERQAQIDAMQARYNVADARRLAEVASAYPNLHPAFLGASVAAGLGPGPQLDMLAQQQTMADIAAARSAIESNRDDADEGFWGFNLLDDFARFGKGAIRTTFLAFDTAWEELLQRPLRTLVGANQGLSLSQAYEQAGASVGRRALEEWRAGRPVNLGSGFFANSELSPETERRMALSPLPDGYRGYQNIAEMAANPEQAELGAPITEIAEAERERIRLTHRSGTQIPVSPGRLLAVQFVEPGTIPFKTVSGLADIGANIFLDPTNIVTGGISKLKKANSFLLPSATYSEGVRPGVLARSWDEWLSSRPGRNVVDFLARNQDYLATHALLKSSNHTVDAGLASALTRESDPQRIATLLTEAASGKYAGRIGLNSSVLGPQSITGRMLGTNAIISPTIGGIVGAGRNALRSGQLGIGVREAASQGYRLGSVGGIGVAMRYTTSGTYLGKMSALVGGRMLSITDLDSGTEDFGELLRSFGFSHNQISKYMQQYSEIEPGEFEGALKVVGSAMREFATKLEAEGIPGPAVRRFAQVFESNATFRRYWTNQAGNPQYFPGGRVEMMLDGKRVEVSSAQLFSEFLNQAIPVPDARAVRKALRRASINRLSHTKMGSIGIKDWDDLTPGALTKLTDEVMTRAWKPMVLLRVAWPVRVITEEQARMWAGGLSSMFNHPIHWLAMALGSRTGVMANDLMGNPMARSRELRAARSRAGTGQLAGPRAKHPVGFLVRPRGHFDYSKGHFIEFNQLATDELAPIVARGGVTGTLDEIKERFFRGDLRFMLERLIRDGKRWDYLSDKTLSDGYIDSIWARINQITGGRFRYLDMRDQQWYDDMGELIPIDQIPLADGSARVLGPDSRTFWGDPMSGNQNPFDTQVGGFDADSVLTLDSRRVDAADLPQELRPVQEAMGDFDYRIAELATRLYQGDLVAGDPDLDDALNLLDNLAEAVRPIIGDDAADMMSTNMSQLIDDVFNTEIADTMDIEDALGRIEQEVLDTFNASRQALSQSGAPAPMVERERVPFLEARRLSDFAKAKRGAIAEANARVGPLQKFTPQPVPPGWIENGVVRFPKGSLNATGIGNVSQVFQHRLAGPAIGVLASGSPDDQARAALSLLSEGYRRLRSDPADVLNNLPKFGGRLPEDETAEFLFVGQGLIFQSGVFGAERDIIDLVDDVLDLDEDAVQRMRSILAEINPDMSDSEVDELLDFVIGSPGFGTVRGSEYGRLLRHGTRAYDMIPEGADDAAELLAYIRDGDIHGFIELARDADGRVYAVKMLKMSDAAGGVGVKALFDHAIARGDFQPDDVLRLLLRDNVPNQAVGGRQITMEEWLRRQPALMDATREAMAEGGMTSEMRVRRMTRREFRDQYTNLQDSWSNFILNRDEIDHLEVARVLGFDLDAALGDPSNYTESEYLDAVVELVKDRLQRSEANPHDIQALVENVASMPDRTRRIGEKLLEYQTFEGVPVRPGGDVLEADEIFDAIAAREGVTKLRKPPEEWTYDDVLEMISAQMEAGHKLRRADAGELLTQRGAATLETGARMLGRRTDDLHNPAYAQNWDQHRAQYELLEPGNPELIEAIASGRLRNIELNKVESPGAERKVMAVLDEIGAGPNFVKVPELAPGDQSNAWDDAVATLFSALMGKPTNMLSRSPAFKQYYWRKVAQMVPYMSDDLREQVLKRAAEEGVDAFTIKGWFRELLKGSDERTKRALEDLATPGMKFSRLGDPDDPIRSMDEVDELAKAFALHETQTLLYDLNTRHNFFDMTRNIFPFGEAWLEIIQTWSKLMAQNPKVLRRFQQTVEGARRSGFFYGDPTTGEEVFNYPGSELFADWMFGDSEEGTPGSGEIQFTGRVAGLNLALGSFMPGVGPVVQFPLSVTGTLNDPKFRQVRDLIMPFGPMDTDDPGSVVNDMLPAWFRRFLVAIDHPTGKDQRLYVNTVIDVYRAMIMSGEGSDKTPEETEDTLEKARERARVLFLYRSAVQFLGPTGAQVRFETYDKEGRLLAFSVLTDEYRRMFEESGYEHGPAFDQFTKTFGLDPTLLYVSKTRSLVRRSVTLPGQIWQSANEDLFAADAFPFTAYYGRPDDIHEEFDYGAYLAQLEEGTRVAMSDSEWVHERNDLLGRLAYENARRRVAGRTDAAAEQWLRDIRAQLMERFPGYRQPRVGLEARPNRDMLIAEYERWADEPRLARTNAGQGLAVYLAARKRASEEGIALGLTPTGFTRARSTRHLRDWLRSVAESTVAKYPDFGLIWDSTFRAEIEEVDEIEAAALSFNLEELIDGTGAITAGAG